MRPWYVITGAPSSGKSTTLDLLAKRGYRVIPEAARDIIDEGIARGLTIEDLRRDEGRFQHDVLIRKQQIEAALPKNEIILLDRGIPDTIAYCRLHNLDESEGIEASRSSKYKHVFVLDPLPFEQDYARVEEEAQVQHLNQLLEEVYHACGFSVTRIPVVAAEKRADIIEAMLH